MDATSHDSSAYREHRYHYGNSPAAWIAVGTILVGFLLGAIALIAAVPELFWLGFGIAIVGTAVGWALAHTTWGESQGQPRSA